MPQGTSEPCRPLMELSITSPWRTMAKVNSYVPRISEPYRLLMECTVVSPQMDNSKGQLLWPKISASSANRSWSQLLCPKVLASLTDRSWSTGSQDLRRIMAEADFYVPRYQRALPITHGALDHKTLDGQQ